MVCGFGRRLRRSAARIGLDFGKFQPYADYGGHDPASAKLVAIGPARARSGRRGVSKTGEFSNAINGENYSAADRCVLMTATAGFRAPLMGSAAHPDTDGRLVRAARACQIGLTGGRLRFVPPAIWGMSAKGNGHTMRFTLCRLNRYLAQPGNITFQGIFDIASTFRRPARSRSGRVFIAIVLFSAIWNLAIAPVMAQETFGAKLRRLAAAAEIANDLAKPPLRPAATWTPNKSYVPGEAVQNGQFLYLCYSGGISAGSGGPAGTGYSNIIDGTAVWVYLGPAIVNAPDSSAPTITSVTGLASLVNLGLTKNYDPLTGTSSFSFGGGTLTPTQPPPFVVFPAVHAYTNGTGGTTGGNTNNYYWTASFVTDAPIVAIGVADYAGTPANIIVDGRKLSPGAYRPLPAASWFILDFTRAGGRKQRVITLEDFGWVKFGGVAVDAASALSSPSTVDRVRVAFLGSSIEAGGNTFPVRNSPTWPVQVAKMLGWSDPWNLGIGGTGYINNQGGRLFNYAGHVNDAISISPDIVVVGGPINDESYGPTQITAAAVSLFKTLRSALPATPIIAMGTYPASRGPDAASLASEIAIQTAVQQVNDPNIYFIPLITAPGGTLLTGTGRVTSPNGKGNSDYYTSSDGTHPTQLGIDYEFVQYAAKIKSIFVNRLP